MHCLPPPPIFPLLAGTHPYILMFVWEYTLIMSTVKYSYCKDSH
jgi:hypothetical protein